MPKHGTRPSQRVRLLTLVLAGAALFSLPMAAATDMLTAVGATTAPTTSSCPSTSTGSCTSGWFSLRGARLATIKVNADAGTNTVVLEHRADSSDTATSTLYTWTNAGTTTVGRAIDPPDGDVRIRVTAIGGGGTVKAKLSATTFQGTRLW